MGRKAAVLVRTESFPPPVPPPEFPETGDVPEGPEAGPEADDDSLEVEAAITDNVGEQSIEINVESLVAELEAESRQDKAPDLLCARRKLEDYLERKRIAQELEDFEDFAVGD